MTESPRIASARDLIASLHLDYDTAEFDRKDILNEFDQHVARAQSFLAQEDLSAFYIVANRGSQTDFGYSTVVDNDAIRKHAQLRLLGVHFRTVLDRWSFETGELVDAMLDEALAIDEVQDEK